MAAEEEVTFVTAAEAEAEAVEVVSVEHGGGGDVFRFERSRVLVRHLEVNVATYYFDIFCQLHCQITTPLRTIDHSSRNLGSPCTICGAVIREQ